MLCNHVCGAEIDTLTTFTTVRLSVQMTRVLLKNLRLLDGYNVLRFVCLAFLSSGFRRQLREKIRV